MGIFFLCVEFLLKKCTGSVETLERLFEENFLNKKCSLIVGQHFGNIILLRQEIPTKNNKSKKLEVVAFGRSNKKIYRFFLYHHVGAHLKNFWRARAATHQKTCLNIK